MKYEYCCKCGCATGRAGAGEDSLYTENDGPFCEGCFPEKQEQGEPVDDWSEWRSMVVQNLMRHSAIDKDFARRLANFYQDKAPQQRTWVGLTEDEMAEIVEGCDGVGWDVAPAIEAKLKEKNT
jgi:hypothetical protein